MKVDPKRQAAKFRKVRQLIRNRNEVRSQIELDMRQSDWSEEALIAYLMFETGLRPGSKSTNRTKIRGTNRSVKTFGACTLLVRHIRILKNGVFLDFVGKKGVRRRVQVTNPAIVDELKWRKAEKEPSERIFDTEYWHVAEYVGLLGYTPKDFRTMVATCKAKELAATLGRSSRDRRALVRTVADQLGNTPAVCRSAYIDPAVLRSFE